MKKMCKRYKRTVDDETTDVVAILHDRTVLAWIPFYRDGSDKTIEFHTPSIQHTYIPFVRLLLAVRFHKYKCNCIKLGFDWQDVKYNKLVHDVWTPRFACYCKNM
jgi:hypothetical protein